MNARASMLPAYLDCARRAAACQWRDVVGDAGYGLQRRRVSVLAAIGTGTHSSASYQLTTKKTGYLCDLGAAVDCGIESFRQEIADGVDYDDKTPNRNAAEDQVKRLSHLYYLKVTPTITPLNVEYRMKAKIGALNVTGQLDVENLSESGNSGIRDTKTGARLKNHHIQTGCYSLLRRSEDPTLTIDELGIDFLRRGTPSRGVEYQHVPYDVATCESLAYNTLLSIASDLAKFMDTGDPWAFRPNPSSVLCSEKYCPAWGTTFCEMGA